MSGLLERWRGRIDGLCPRRTTDRLHRIGCRFPSASRSGRLAGKLLAASSLAFVGLVVASFGLEGELAVVTKPLPLRAALALPPVIGALAAVTAGGTILAWHRGYWSRAARLHYTVVAVLGLLFTWQLRALGFLS